jgi:MYXO-CTERM domain-containing protein
MPRITRLVIFAGLVGLAALCTSNMRPARADWPLPRGDRARSGATRGQGNLVAPVPYWRYYLGGAIGPRQARVLDIDVGPGPGGLGELVFVAGGKLMARDRDDNARWETPVLGIDGIVAADDLDGDGQLDLVARAGDRVIIASAATGQVLWAEPGDDLGTLGDVRVGDLDADGVSDLLVQECGCCRINNGATGFAYRFARGFDAAERLWTLPSVLCGGTLSMAIADVDGDGRAEVILGERRRIVALDGGTGAEVAATPQLGDRVGQSRCLPLDVDGDPGEELVCLQSNQALPASEPGHRLFVLGHARDAAGEAELVVLWQRDVGEVHGQARFAATPVVDLDGDGALEIVTSGVEAAGAATTYVHDAATGSLRATAAGQRVAGTIAAAPGEHTALILTAQGDDLHAWSLAGDALALQWSLPDRRAVLEPDWALAARAYVAERVLAPALLDNLSGASTPALLTMSTRPGGALIAHDLSSVTDAGPRTVATHAVDADSGPAAGLLAAWTASSPGGPGAPATPGAEPAALLGATSDGRMQLLDSALAPVQRSVRFGGYLPRGDWRNLHLTPVAGDLGTGADSIVVRDSRGALVRIDAQGASLASPPVARWEVPDASSPILLGPQTAGGAGGEYQAIACRQETADGNDRVLVLDRDGQPRWQADLPGVILSDLVPARLQRAGSGVLADGLPDARPDDLPDDLIVQWGRASDVALQHRAFAGDTGAVLWDAVPQTPGTSRFPAGGAVTDWNGDGVDDFVHQYYGTQVLSGVDGAVLAESGDTDLVQFMPTIHDVDGDGRSEVVLHGGFAPARALDDDLVTPLWVSPDNDLPYPYGALAEGCADGVPRLAEGSLLHPATLKLTPLFGPDAGVHQRMVLAGGKVYENEAAATAAGALLGQLTSAAVHANLAGASRPIAVVGSDDGWLYAVDACAAELWFAVPLGAAVGAIAFADTNADGLDEILAAAGDGHLYALAQPPIAAPALVIDVEPGAAPLPGAVDGVPDVDDVDEVRVLDRMAAVWQAVPGADGYQVAVVGADTGRIVSAPAWQDVGTATSAVITGLPLAPGRRYVFAVRALTGGAPSPDAMSDGVLIGDATPAPPGPPGPTPPGEPAVPADPGDTGCGCRSTGTEPGGAAWLLLAGVAGLALRRPRRRGPDALRSRRPS